MMNKMNLPAHWEILPFTDCVKKVKTKKKPSIPKRDYQESGEFPVIDQGGSFIAGWTDLTESVISDNLPVVIFGDHTRIFKYVDFPFAPGADGTQLLYPNNDILDSRFFYYALLNLKVPNKGYNRHYRYLREFSVACPPLPEQRAIAHVLQTIQEAKFTRQREVALERERKAALMDYLFSHGTKDEPRKQTEIGKIPESWKMEKLGNVLNYIRNGLTNKQNKVGNGYPVTRIETISEDCINAEKVGYVDALPNDRIKKYRLSYGDILVSHINSDPQLGRAVIYEGKPELLIHGMNLLRMQANTEVINPFFLHFIFGVYRNRGIFIALASRAVGQSSINQSRMKSLMIPLPSLPEQDIIAQILQAIDERVVALEKEVQHLDELFHAMLDELMTGKRSAIPLIENGVVQ